MTHYFVVFIMIFSLEFSFFKKYSFRTGKSMDTKKRVFWKINLYDGQDIRFQQKKSI